MGCTQSRRAPRCPKPTDQCTQIEPDTAASHTAVTDALVLALRCSHCSSRSHEDGRILLRGPTKHDAVYDGFALANGHRSQLHYAFLEDAFDLELAHCLEGCSASECWLRSQQQEVDPSKNTVDALIARLHTTGDSLVPSKMCRERMLRALLQLQLQQASAKSRPNNV